MKLIVIAIALSCVLSSAASAGQIPSVPVAPPPPEDESQTTSTTAPGDVPSVDYTDQMSGTALDLVQMMVGMIV